MTLLCSRLMLGGSAPPELLGRVLGGRGPGSVQGGKAQHVFLKGLQCQGIGAQLREEEYHEENRVVRAERDARRETVFAEAASAPPSVAGKGGRRRDRRADPKVPFRRITPLAQEGGSLTAGQVTAMVTEIGVATPFAMANATGGETGCMALISPNL